MTDGDADPAAGLRPYVATLPTDSPVFPLPKDKGAELLQADLAVAGIAYRDMSGLFFDFHSLRCQMATMDDAAGIATGVVQRRMRHSTQERTERYIRPRAVDIDAVASKLPSLKPNGDRTETLALTGTDGPVGHRQLSDPTGPVRTDPEDSGPGGSSISKGFGHHLATGGTFPVGMSRFLT